MFAPVLRSGRSSEGNPGDGGQDDYQLKNAYKCITAHAQNMNNA